MEMNNNGQQKRVWSEFVYLLVFSFFLFSPKCSIICIGIHIKYYLNIKILSRISFKWNNFVVNKTFIEWCLPYQTGFNSIFLHSRDNNSQAAADASGRVVEQKRQIICSLMSSLSFEPFWIHSPLTLQHAIQQADASTLRLHYLHSFLNIANAIPLCVLSSNRLFSSTPSNKGNGIEIAGKRKCPRNTDSIFMRWTTTVFHNQFFRLNQTYDYYGDHSTKQSKR